MTSAKRKSADPEQLHRLQTLLQRAGASPPPAHFAPQLSTGAPPLDALLPRGAYRRGALVEWLAPAPDSGAAALALVAAREAHADGGAVVVIDRTGTFYPPAAAAWRLDLASTIVVHPTNDKDEHWALDQALRCQHAAAVLAWPRRLDDRTFRRLQLAAETSGAIGLFIRPLTTERDPSWADLRLAVAPNPVPLPTVQSEPGRGHTRGARVGLRRSAEAAPRASPDDDHQLMGWQLTVRLLRCRGRFGKKEGEVVLEIDERTGEIHASRPRHLAPELAHPTPAHHHA